MTRHRVVKNRLPELGITALLLFFSLRELGSFPASWADEGLFLTVAKMVALGRGYALPFLHTVWYYPYFLNVGPTFIYPAALAMHVFGISIAAGRIPMVLYIWTCAACLYAFTRKLFNLGAARWATLLLVTLSAFINTGKTALGEIPGFAFLLAGLIALEWSSTRTRRTVWSGIWFGLAFLTKITYGMVLPALGAAWLAALWKRKWGEALSLACTAAITVMVFLPWRILEMTHTLGGSLIEEIHNFIGGGGKSEFFYVLREQSLLLTRLPFLAFGVFAILGGAGLWAARTRLSRTLWTTVTVLLLFFILYFFQGYGWYRLLLPGHLLLLPFVPTGAYTLFGKKKALATLLLGSIVCLQAAWQFSHEGSNPSTEGDRVAAYVESHYHDRDIIIEQTEIFARLPDNPHWLFLVPNLSFSLPKRFTTLMGDLCTAPVLRKLSDEEQATYKAQLTRIAGTYFVITPKPGQCIAPAPTSIQ